MLIIEGPDGVGKTTFARQLTKALAKEGHVYAHFTRLPDGFDRYWGYVERMSVNVVQDRFHMSEVLYAETRGDDTPLTPEYYLLIDARLRLLAGFTVLITADRELVAERWHSEQMFGKEATVAVAQSYQQVVSGGALLRTNKGAYFMDVDYYIHCNREHPYPDEQDQQQILALYRRRLVLHHQVGARKPSTL